MHMAFLSRVFKNLQWYGMTKIFENFGFRGFFVFKPCGSFYLWIILTVLTERKKQKECKRTR